MRYNVPKSCAARLCRACEDFPVCVAVMYLTLRTGYAKHGSKNPLPYPISERSHVGNLRQIRNQGKGRSSKRKGNRRCPFLLPSRRAPRRSRRRRRRILRCVQRKIPRPLGANTLTRLVYPHCRCSENPRYFTKRQTNNRNHRSVFLTLSGKPPSKMLLN